MAAFQINNLVIKVEDSDQAMAHSEINFHIEIPGFEHVRDVPGISSV